MPSSTEDILFRAGLDPRGFQQGLVGLRAEFEDMSRALEEALSPGEGVAQLGQIRELFADILGDGNFDDFDDAFDPDRIREVGSLLQRVFGSVNGEGIAGFANLKNSVDAFATSMKDLGEESFGVVEDSARSVVGHIQNAFTNFVRTGELDFERLANSIATSLANIAFEEYIKEPLEGIFEDLFSVLLGNGKDGGILGSIFSFLGNGIASLFTGGGGAASKVPLKGFALGGSVTGGRPYVVGEQGRELFVPETSGRIVPNHAMGGSIVFNVQTKDADSFRRSESQIAAMLHRVASRGNRNL